MKLNRLFILSLCFIALASCGKDPAALQDETIIEAQYLLSGKNCDEAISKLESLPYNHTDARYLKTLSSAYACKANYSTITFFANDIEKTTQPAPIGGMTTYSSSLVATTDSIDTDNAFKNLAKAIDVLLYAGGLDKNENPTIALRAEHFSPKIVADLHNQLAFMMMVQLGKYMKIYGNTNAAGKKGLGVGTGANNCFTDYTQSSPEVQFYMDNSNATGACIPGGRIPHPDIKFGATKRKEKLCRGVTIMNNLIDLLPEVLASSGGGQTTSLANFIRDLKLIRTDFISLVPRVEDTLMVTGYKKCVDEASIDEENLENAFAAYFETMVK